MSVAPFLARAGAAPEPLLVDARTAAGMLSVSERLLWSLTQAREIGAVRIGKRVLYPVQGLKDWVAAHTVGGPGMGVSAGAAAPANSSIETPPEHDLKHPQAGPPVRPPTGTTLDAVEGER